MSMQKTFSGLLFPRGLTALIGCLGLIWGIANLPQGEAADDFRDIETLLLQFADFGSPTQARVLASMAARDASPCNSHAQRTLLLMEIPLADAALRSGAVNDYNQRTRSMESRVRQALACTPHDAFLWMVLFGLETGHGVLDEHAFDLLATSYDNSPNEAWIGVRRILLAVPTLRSAPAAIQEKVLAEFESLIRHGFVEMPARAYQSASEPVRALLQSRLNALDERSQKAFSEASAKLRS